MSLRSRDDFESIHGPTNRLNWNSMQSGFPHSHQLEERNNNNNLYHWNRTQSGSHFSPLEEPMNRHNQNRRQARSPHFSPPEEPMYYQNETPRFSNPRRVVGGPFGLNSVPTGHRSRRPPPLRFLVVEDNVQGNSWPTRPPPPAPPSPPPFRTFMERRDSPQSSTNESKLTKEEQHKVLSKLRREFYNPSSRTGPNLYFRDKNYSNTTPVVSKEKDENWKRCTICLEDFEAREEVVLTPCNHMFHEDCIVPWVKNHGLCPVCRFAICERLNQNAADDAPPPPRRRLPPPPPPVDGELLALIRALSVDDDDHELQGMIPFVMGR